LVRISLILLGWHSVVLFGRARLVFVEALVDQKYFDGVLYDHVRGETDGVLGSCTPIGACCRFLSLILGGDIGSFTAKQIHTRMVGVEEG
jgi:hypothetical protein